MSTRTFDDRDPAIQYMGLWSPDGNPQTEYNGTTTVTKTPGSLARVAFTGTGISVFGTIAISEAPPISNYTIDNDPLTAVHFVGVPTNEVQYGVKFYGISNLEFGQHVLRIRNEQANAELFLDFFTVTGPNEVSPASSSVVVPSFSSIALPSASAPSNPVEKSSDPPLGSIIGGLLGGVGLIGFLAVAILVSRSRRGRRNHVESGADQLSNPPVLPFRSNGRGAQAPSWTLQDVASTSNSGASHHSEKQLLASQSLSSKASMDSASSSTYPPSRNTNTMDPPPLYELEPF
ncbi:hypothetical protein BKA70DRAFT_712953 [Coprinopsis sp. MPI-PUGE-AT-0042]|nr:hypothetical protein BKA70DRAFT_712953 [Coprinopsis sp. MPI-PUGE-AT-0042]